MRMGGRRSQMGFFWWIPLAAAAAGAVLKAEGEKRQSDQRNRLADALQAYQSGKAAEGRSAIEGYAGGLTPEARTTERLGIQDELRKNFETSAEQSKGYEAPQDFAGRAPRRFEPVRAAGRSRTDERLRRAIDQFSVMGAPAQRDLRQAVRYGTAATDVDASNTAANNLARAYAAAIAAQREPGLTRYGSQFLGGVAASGYGS